LEVVLNELVKRKIIVYPFAGFFGKSSDFPTDSDKQILYLKYTLARLAPYWNLLFNIAGPEPMLKKQHEKYRNAMEKEDIVRLGNLIGKLDVFNHLLSVHNPTYFAHDGDWFIEEDWYTFGTLQGPKTLNRQELRRKLLKNHHPQKPLLAQETLWGGNTFGHPHYTEIDIRKHAYVMTMSAAAINFGDMNGSSSSGFSGTLDFNQKHQIWHDVIKAVWDFFETLPFYEMKPSQDLVNNGYCLANPGKEYWVYLELPGKVSVNVEDGEYLVQWINAQNTEDRRRGGNTRDGKNLTTLSGSNDWFLRIIINKNS
jgi:hypothetical protein